MNSSKYNFNFSLDLSFKFHSDITFLIKEDHNNEFLIDEELWNYCLYLWIKDIRSNQDNNLYDSLNRSKNFSVGLEFVSNQTISLLNKKWLKKSGITDVISFPALDDNSPVFGEVLELGDIFVSVPQAIEQAKSNFHQLSYEILWLISHGFLHLLGLDHDNENSLHRMISFQEDLITKNLDELKIRNSSLN
tara:strand:- start:572 stop:1144 length:573 start_codon:yes stop_codon:yes gene_type:complete